MTKKGGVHRYHEGCEGIEGIGEGGGDGGKAKIRPLLNKSQFPPPSRMGHPTIKYSMLLLIQEYRLVRYWTIH